MKDIKIFLKKKKKKATIWLGTLHLSEDEKKELIEYKKYIIE